MHKRYKLITTIACLLLCVGMVAFGVYAASNALVTLSSKVSFTPTTAKLKIFGGVYGSTTKDGETSLLKYYADNSGDTVVNGKESTDKTTVTFNTWEFGKINFDGSYINDSSKEKPDPIYFFVQISNYVERDINYKIKINSETSGKNVTVCYGYYEESNAELAITPVTKCFWDLGGTSASTVPFVVADADTKITDTNFSNNESAVITGNAFETTMLVMKVEIDDPDKDADFTFNFTITMA